MSGFGSFSPEAYQQLQEAYARQLSDANQEELAGFKVGGDVLGVETVPVKNAWLDKTGLWQYPDGKGQYDDVEQKQQDLLAALRNEDGEVELEQEEKDLSGLSDEELDSMIDEILDDLEDEESETTIAEDDSEGDEEMTDEELDALIDEILAEVDEEEPSDTEDEEIEDARSIAEKIETLKAELEEMSSALVEDEEESEDGEALEPQDSYEADEETTEDLDEEEPSDDESD